jgi:outer membrane protein assembly factor BamB
MKRGSFSEQRACAVLLAAASIAATVLAATLSAALITGSARAASWPMKHRDMQHTGRADYVVPQDRLNDSFFDVFLWQKPSPDSPESGNLSGSNMVFFDGAGPGGADLVVSGYHWPKGLQGMDRHTGSVFWNGNPEGGETIGRMTPAFSNDGTTIYCVNDATESEEFPNGHPFMAFSSTVGPSVYRHNGNDPEPSHLQMDSPTVAPDGRIFLHDWIGRPHAGSDNGSSLTEVWAAGTHAECGHSDPSLYQDGATLKVVVGSRWGAVICYDGATGVELWSVSLPRMVDATVTIDPANGNIYVGAGDNSIDVVGLDTNGNALWGDPSAPVYTWIEGQNNAQRAQSAGCLSHDGLTYYFQTTNAEGEGALHAINTADGSIRWTYPTGSRLTGWELASSPIVTQNGVIIVGNDEGDTYFALLDAGTQGTLLDTLPVNLDQQDGHARSGATLSSTGELYLPARIEWTVSNGDGDTPSHQVENLFVGFDLKPLPVASWPTKHRDMYNTGRADYTVPAERMNSSFFDVFLWQKPSPDSPGDGGFSASSMVFYDGAGPGGADLVAAGYHWPKGVQGMDRETGHLFWTGLPDGGETIGRVTPAFSNDGQTLYVINDATQSTEWPNGHPLMAFSSLVGPGVFRHNGTDPNPGHMDMGEMVVSPDGRVFAHQWTDRPYGFADDGLTLTEAFAAQTAVSGFQAYPALYSDDGILHVVMGGTSGEVKAWNGATGAELWSAIVPGLCLAGPTIDPANGNVYLTCHDWSHIYVIGLTKDGAPLWGDPSIMIWDGSQGGTGEQRPGSTGCLSHDGSTYYFQTTSTESDGRLFAVNTADGSLKWEYVTGSTGAEEACSAPIVTENGVIVVGNNDGDVYLAIHDTGAAPILLDTISVDPDDHFYGHARCTATLAPDGRLYLPLRTIWTASNGDGDIPTYEAANVFSSFDLTADAQPQPLPPPTHQAAFIGNHSVRVTWSPAADPLGLFDHYAVYRDTQPFTSVAGMTPIGSVADIHGAEYVDETAQNGSSYYYAVTSVIGSGAHHDNVTGIGPRTPRDETDLQVVCIARTPRYPRYDPVYSYYEVSDPNGFGPYAFGAATGLGSGQDENTQRCPNVGDPVTYTATVRNRGTNGWTGSLSATWSVDGVPVAHPGKSVALASGDTTAFAFVLNWDGDSHEILFSIEVTDARAENNALSINTKSVAFLSYIDRTRMEEFREETTQYPLAVTDDFIDWLNRHMTRFNQMFAQAGCAKRVHFDILEVLDDLAPDPGVPTIDFAVFPFRYRVGEGSPRSSGYYSAEDEIDFGLLHEMGHQLGLIDLYQLNMSPDQNEVTRDGYSAPACLMNGCSRFISEHSANAMNHWMDTAHGYFGQYLYQMPEQVKMRFLGFNSQPLAGAAVTIYQKVERPGIGVVMTNQVKAQGTTNANGEWILPNVPIDPGLVPPAYNGDVLHDNPFGYVSVIGTNGVFLLKVEKDGFTDYCWLDITEVNNAYWAGQTGTATFERNLLLGGEIQLTPPAELTELNASSWLGWADGGSNVVTNDTIRRRVGQGSIRAQTDGGFDTYLRYPADRLARWDLRERSAIRVWFYADNPNGGFQDSSPWIRLKNANGFFEYRPTEEMLNQAIGQWVEFVIPLAGNETWVRTTVGSPDLGQINSIEIHADTWGYGFTLWVDGLTFQLDPSSDTEGTEALPTRLALHQNAPNPFGDQTSIRFDLPVAETVSVAVFDIGGRLVRTLCDGPTAAGRHTLAWDGRDQFDHRLSRGVYLVRMAAGSKSFERKVVLTNGER